jgi:hypothetical protein
MTSWNLNVCKKSWLKLCVNGSSAFKVNKQHLRTFQYLMGTHLHLFPQVGAGDTHYWAWESCTTWCSCCRAWILPSKCLSGRRESQVNIFYHTSGHKDAQCPCFATIPSLSPCKKQLSWTWALCHPHNQTILNSNVSERPVTLHELCGS